MQMDNIKALKVNNIFKMLTMFADTFLPASVPVVKKIFRCNLLIFATCLIISIDCQSHCLQIEFDCSVEYTRYRYWTIWNSTDTVGRLDNAIDACHCIA